MEKRMQTDSIWLIPQRNQQFDLNSAFRRLETVNIFPFAVALLSISVNGINMERRLELAFIS